jgi:hypothetical protein
MNSEIARLSGPEVSPYLRRPLRTFAEACREITAKRQAIREARAANANAPIHAVDPVKMLRRGFGQPA